jgi:hypothetical protein
MRVIFYDHVQDSNAPAALKSASLADTYAGDDITITFPSEVTVDCIGIGNTDATQVILQLGSTIVDSEMPCLDGESGYGELSCVDPDGEAILSGLPAFDVEVIDMTDTGTLKNGCYYLGEEYTMDSIIVSHNGTYIGRFAIGKGVLLGCSPSREPGLWSTAEPRRTLSGQVVPGAGGVTGREIQVDVRYKIDADAWEEIESGHAQYGTGLPVFVLFDDEAARFPWLRLYASTDNEMTFQSSVMGQKLYSRQFKFREAF